MDTTSSSSNQSQIIRQSDSTKQVITITLQYPQCSLMLVKDQFNKHLKKAHSINPYRCFFKGCRQSLTTSNNKQNLAHHLTQSHQSTTEWHCDKCHHQLTSHSILSTHNAQLHQPGHFQCSFPACTFTGQTKNKVYNHYALQHKQILACPSCHFRTPYATDLKIHEGIYAAVKPYSCKWPLCDYASASIFGTIEHICQMHFNGKLHESVRIDEYIELNEMPLDNPDEHDADGGSEEEPVDGHSKNGEKVQDNQEDDVTSRAVKPQLKKCQHSGCSYQTNYAADLKIHQRRHLGIKPYKCKWPQCDYDSTYRSDTIRHIRRKHFKGEPSASIRLGDYVEVNEMLLKNMKSIIGKCSVGAHH